MAGKKNKTKTDYDRLIDINKKAAGIMSIVFLLLMIIYILLVTFTVDTVYVEGNEHYTAAQIRNIVQDRWFGNNSLYLSLAYSGHGIKNIPFVETIDVDVVDRHTIRISVYEKKMAGYVEYLGTNIYFDKDGIVVESSKMKTAGIPLVTGLSFDHFVMYEQLPVTDTQVFQQILNVTQLLNKYEIITDKIFFSDSGNMTLYFDKVRVGIGSSELIEEKIQRLDAILPKLEGKAGYLEMSTYENGKEDFTFTND